MGHGGRGLAFDSWQTRFEACEAGTLVKLLFSYFPQQLHRQQYQPDEKRHSEALRVHVGGDPVPL